MAYWTLATIRTKARQLSGRLSVTDLDNIQLDDYINSYFQYEFPAAVKLNRNYVLYEFHTESNVQEYDFSDDYTNFVPTATIDRQPIVFYQDPDQFYNDNPVNVQRFSAWTGDGVTTGFSTVYNNNIPIQAGSGLVDDSVEVFTDDGLGNLVGSLGGTGTIDYATGAIAVTFATAPTNGQVIQVSFIQYLPGFPNAVLMFDNKFTFAPIPDWAYRFRIKAWSLLYVKPVSGAVKASFTLADDQPLMQEWGPAIAFGASRRICSDFGEMDRYAELTALYTEQLDYILTRTHIDLESTRAAPQF